MKNLLHKLRRRIIEKRGASLTETIVAFGLTCSILAASITAMVSYSSVFSNINSISRARSVSAVLVKEISSELTPMSTYIATTEEKPGKSGVFGEECSIPNPVDENTSYGLVYRNDSGHEVRLYYDQTVEYTADDGTTKNGGYLHIDYSTVAATVGSSPIPVAQWYYSPELYFNNIITSMKLTVVRNGVEDSNLLKLEMSLHNTSTGYNYSLVEYIECHNIEDFQ